MTPADAGGAAFIDRAGVVLAADPVFLAALALPAGEPGALRARAEADAGLRAALAGEGTRTVRLSGAGEVELELTCIEGAAGTLLVVRSPRRQELLEHGQRSRALTRLVGGLSHDIKNPLNAVALQLALLAEKLPEGPESIGARGHLGSIREQVGRINEVLRRFLDVTEPSTPAGYGDLGALLADLVKLFGHEACRRRLELVAETPRGALRTVGDPVQTGRLVLVLFAGAMAATPDGGRVEVRADAEGEQVVLRLVHATGDREPEEGYDTEVVAAGAEQLAGALSVQPEGGVRRLVLRLPRNERT